jgi:hypothetical protein
VKLKTDPMDDSQSVSIVNKDSDTKTTLSMSCGILEFSDTIVNMSVETNNLFFWDPDSALGWIKATAKIRFDKDKPFDIAVTAFHNSKSFYVGSNPNFFSKLISSQKLAITSNDGKNFNTKVFDVTGLRNELISQKVCSNQIVKSCRYFKEKNNATPLYCKEFS